MLFALLRQCALDCPVQRHCKVDFWDHWLWWVWGLMYFVFLLISAMQHCFFLNTFWYLLSLAVWTYCCHGSDSSFPCFHDNPPPPQTVLLSALMFQVLRTVGLRAFSMASETYTSGTHSAAFVTCPNDTVAKQLARWYEHYTIPTPSPPSHFLCCLTTSQYAPGDN